MAKTEAQRTKKALESQKTRLEAERQTAWDEQDTDKFNKIETELTQTQQEIQQTQAVPVDQAYIDGEHAFAERNDWYGKDKLMTAGIMSVAQTLRPLYGENESKDYYAALEEEMKVRYPDKFRNMNRDRAGAVSGDKPSGSSGKSKGFDSLTPEHKVAYAEILEYAPNFSKADYAKSIQEQE